MHQFVMNVESNFKLGTFIWLLRSSDFHTNTFLRMWWILRDFLLYKVDKSRIEYMVNNSCILPPPPIHLVYGTIRGTMIFPPILCHSTTKHYHSACKIFGFIHFVPILYGTFTISLSLWHTQHTLEKLLWIQLFWMKKMKFYCIAYTKVWSKIKCIYS